MSSDEFGKRLSVSRATATDIREVLALISMGSDLRLYKWREWIGGELGSIQLADALDEWGHQMSRYAMQLGELSARLRRADTASSDPTPPR